MTTGVQSPTPILQFFGNDGSPLVGGSILTQVGGVNTPVYSDSGLTTPLPNPIPLNSRGEVSTAAGASSQLFLTPNSVYTFTASDANGNQVWVASSVSGALPIALTPTSIGTVLWPQTAAEIAASVTPTNYAIPNDTGLARSRRFSNTNAWDYRYDQRMFELYLSKYGAVFNGTTDDGPAISDALNAMTALGGYRRNVIMPSGTVSAKINSGFTILTGAIGVDFNGLEIDASGIASGTVITIDQNTGGTSFNPQSTVTPIRNLYLIGDTASLSTPTMLSINGVTSDVVNVLFENLHIIGGNVGIDFVTKCWLLQFTNCKCHGQTQYGLKFTGTTTAGEGILWQGGAIANIQNSGKTGVGCYFPQPASNSNNQLDFTAVGTLIDANDSAVTLGQGTADFFGCTFEGATGTGALFTVTAPSTGPQASLSVIGGSVTTPGSLAEILNISGGEGATANLDIDMELYGITTTVVNRSGNCTVDLNLRRVNFGGLTASAYPTIGSAIADNYNGGFETGDTNGWTLGGTGITFTAQSGTKHSGSYAGEVAASSATGQIQTNNVAVVAGGVVTVDAWAYVTALSAGTFTLTLDYLDGAGVQVSNTTLKTWSTTDTGWNRYAYRLGAPAGAQSVTLKLNATGATGTAFIDDSYIHSG